MLNIRKMDSNDRAQVLAMDTEFYSGPAVDHQIPETELLHTFELAITADYPLDGFILTDDDGIAGFAYVTWFHSTDVAGLCVLLEEIFIRQSARGRGYGPEFIRFMFDHYKDARRFRLEVTKENAAATHVYRKMGFDYISYDQMYKDVDPEAADGRI